MEKACTGTIAFFIRTSHPIQHLNTGEISCGSEMQLQKTFQHTANKLCKNIVSRVRIIRGDILGCSFSSSVTWFSRHNVPHTNARIRRGLCMDFSNTGSCMQVQKVYSVLFKLLHQHSLSTLYLEHDFLHLHLRLLWGQRDLLAGSHVFSILCLSTLKHQISAYN